MDHDKHLHVEVRAVDVEYGTLDSFGQVTGANLRLKCQSITKATVSLPFSKPHEIIELPKTSELPVRLNARLDVAGGTEVGDGLLYLLGLPGRLGSQVTGLILKATGKEKGQYQRIGSFFSLGYQLPFVQQAFGNPAIQVSEADCVRTECLEDGSKIYVIDIA